MTFLVVIAERIMEVSSKGGEKFQQKVANTATLEKNVRVRAEYWRVERR